MKKQGLLQSPKSQSLLILGLSILVGLGTFLYLFRYEATLEAKNSLTRVYVATAEIPSGTTLKEIADRNWLTLRSIPEKSLPADAIRDFKSVDQTLKTRGLLTSGQLLLSSYFTSEVRADVALTIPRGMLATTISVDDVSRVGNFVLPGSKVVVFVTSSTTNSTRVLLPSALVLSIGNQTNINLGSNSIAPSPLVTLALTPRDAQRLILASQNMKLTLALAYDNDPSSVLSASMNTTASDLFNS